MTTLIILLFSLLAVNSTGSEVDDTNSHTEPTVSDCIRSRWKVWVSLFDVDLDGIISVADFAQARKRFTELHNLTGEDKALREEMFTSYYFDAILWNNQSISVDEFVALQSNALLDDKDKLVAKIKKNEDLLHAYLDVDNNGYISEEETTIFMSALGMPDEKKDKDFFKGFNPDDKGVSLKAMTKYWVNYLVDDNCFEETESTQKILNVTAQ